jgi:hypothetical protein
MITDHQKSIHVTFAALLCLTGVLADFQEGEFVPTSRRGQFHEVCRNPSQERQILCTSAGMFESIGNPPVDSYTLLSVGP